MQRLPKKPVLFSICGTLPPKVNACRIRRREDKTTGPLESGTPDAAQLATLPIRSHREKKLTPSQRCFIARRIFKPIVFLAERARVERGQTVGGFIRTGQFS